MITHHESNHSSEINLNLLKRFVPSKNFSNHLPNTQITSVNYDESGKFLITSGTDESLQLYDVPKGVHLKSIFSKKYGCHLAMFTHRSQSRCIFASTKENHVIRLLNLKDNSFLQYFKGHTGQVINLVNSTSSTRADSFYSSSIDYTVKCWDTRVNTFTSSLSLDSTPLIALDSSNSVMAVLEVGTNILRLIPLEKFPSGIIKVKDVTNILIDYSTPDRSTLIPKSIKFTNDNKHIIITTSGSRHVILNAYTLRPLCYLTGQISFTERKYIDTGNLSVTPNGQFVVGGSGNGEILLWNIGSLADDVDRPVDMVPQEVISNQVAFKQQLVPRIVAVNPRFGMWTTADMDVTFWVPN